uniref:DUF6338 family protein n=1 Tax=Pseudomonas fulva TaxID=47880 RepID=UPI001F218A33|nr:DUF6338 family protein [Pseudomonas fulva]
MDIWAADKLILFIAFVIPGFISIKCYQLLQPGVVRNAADQVVDAIAYSCINYALFLWLIFAVERSALRDAHPLLYGIFYVVVLLVGPVIWAVMWRWMRSWEVFQRNAPHPTAKPWDFIFQQRKPYWVIVHLKGGGTIGGLYGGQSFASSAPAPEQIYLEQEWIVEDGGLTRAVESSAGVLISGTEIAHIEFRQFRG